MRVSALLALLICATLAMTRADADAVQLRLWVTGAEYQRPIQEQLRTFEARNPNVHVELNVLDWGSYRQQILTGLAGGAPPDVITFYSSDLATFAGEGLLRNLSGEIRREDWQPGALSAMSLGGNLYALPWGIAVRCLNYRADLFAAAGIHEPPKTWDEFRIDASKLTVRDASGRLRRAGVWLPVDSPFKTPSIFVIFLRGNGGSVLTADGRLAAFNSPQGVEAARFIADLIKKTRVDDPGAISQPLDFIQGRAAMAIENGFIGPVQKFAKSLIPDVKLALPPYEKVPVAELGAEGVAVTAASRHPAEGMRLALFLTEDAAASAAHDATSGYIPATKAGLDSSYARSSPWIPQLLPLLPYARPLPVTPQYQQIEAILADALEQIYTTNADAKPVLDEAARKVDALLAGSSG